MESDLDQATTGRYELRPQGRVPDGPITLAADELDDYKEVPLAKLRPWPQGTGPALRDWLAARGFDPPFVDFGTPLEL